MPGSSSLFSSKTPTHHPLFGRGTGMGRKGAGELGTAGRSAGAPLCVRMGE